MNKIILGLATIAIFASSCIKTTEPKGSAALILVNAMVGSGSLVTNFGGNSPLQYYAGAFRANYGSFYSGYKFNSYNGPGTLSLYNYPDTTQKPVLNVSFDLPSGSIHSLFLTGTLDHPESVFTEDKLPYYVSTDSSAGIRFVNLSPQSNPISINLQGGANGSEVVSLPYKGVTAFKPYRATYDIASYSFEFRDATSGSLITTYTAWNVGSPGQGYAPNPWMFKNNTLALIGSPDSTGRYQQQVLLINNF